MTHTPSTQIVPATPTEPAQHHRRVQVLGLVLVAGMSLTISGCGSDSTAGPDAQDEAGATSGSFPDPCGLLTDAEVNATTGSNFNPGAFNEGLSNEAQSICDWTKTTGGVDVVQVLVADAATFAANQESASLLGEIKNLSDIGDAAYSTADGSLIGFKSGDLFVQVSWFGADSTPAATRSLAESAAANS
ncbi:DUF3558 domain-containing protein [Candidatus Nanopelagicales bacterium]|nr:DUF3558 domain-containing protein [Candidatus Nanopelagicales bacterium]